jgi:hypothetical protein
MRARSHALFSIGLVLALALGARATAQQSQPQVTPAEEAPGKPAHPKPKPKGGAFAHEQDPEARGSLYEEWRKSRPNKFKDQGDTGEGGVTPIVRSHSGPAMVLPESLQLVNGENVGRASMAINSAGSVLFTRILGGAPTWTSSTGFPTGRFVTPTSGKNNPWRFEATTGGTSGPLEPNWPVTLGTTIADGTITWISRTGPCDPNPQLTPSPPFPAYGGGRHNGDIGPGCQPIQLVVRSSGGSETVIAQEGDVIPGGGDLLTGWGEYYDLNSSGVAAFKAAFAPTASSFSADEESSALFTAGPGAGNLARIIKSGDVVNNVVMCGFGPMVMINNAGQVGFEGYAIATPWKPTTASSTFLSNRVAPTVPNGFYFTVQAAGTTGAVEPAWPTINGATIVDGTVTWRANTLNCRNAGDEFHELLRYTPGPGVQHLFGIGTDIGGGVFVKNIGQNNDQYDNIDRHFTSNGNMAIVAILSDGSQGVYHVTGPGTFTQVARTGVAIPGIGLVDQIGDKLAINNSDQVLMKLSIGGDGDPSTQDQGADMLVLFTPPATYTKVATGRTGPSPGGRGCAGTCGPGPLGQVVDSTVVPPATIEGFGAHFDMNSNGDVVFKAGLEQCSVPSTCVGFPGVDSNELSSVFYWDKGTSTLTEVARTGKLDDRAKVFYGFFTEVITVTDGKVVLFGNRNSGSFVPRGDPNDLYVALYTWTLLGGVKSVAQVGDTLNGSPIFAMFPQHLPFNRQINASGQMALEAFVNSDDPDDAGDQAHNGMLLLATVGVSCNAPAPPVLGLVPSTVNIGQNATLSWNGTLAPGSGNYGVYRAAGGPFTLLATVPASSAGPFSYTYTATGPNGTQDFQVRAIPSCNPALFSTSNKVSLTVTGCAKSEPPPHMAIYSPIVPMGFLEILTWDPPNGGFGGLYTVRFSTDNGATFSDFAAGLTTNGFTFLVQFEAGSTVIFEVVADPGCGPAGISDPSPTVTMQVVQACPKAIEPVALVDALQFAVGDFWSLHWTATLPVVGGVTDGIYEIRISQDNGATFHVVGTTTGTTFTGGPVPQEDQGKLIFFQVIARPSCGTGDLSSGYSNVVFFIALAGCEAPNAPSNVSLAAAGVSPPRPPSPIEYILASWLSPVGGAAPTRYGVRINGDPEVLTTFTSLILPPRGGKDPITAFVTAYTCGILISAEVFAGAGQWIPTGKLGVPRQSHTATLLSGGNVLVAGGTSTPFGPAIASAELFDPGTGGWSPTANLTTARQSHTATALSNGNVLVAGGVSAGLSASSVFPSVAEGTLADAQLSSAELYDSAAKTWSATGNLGTPRAQHTATLLSNGKVLVAGGRGSAPLNTVELYDPTTGLWSSTGQLQTARLAHTATLLPNGKVLVAGGVGASGVLASAELYDTSTGAWSLTGSLGTARESQTATLLSSGKVLVSGGDDGGVAIKGAELYDPAAGTWSATGSLGTARTQHTATLLPGGAVLAVGGSVLHAPSLKSAELYDPAAGTWSATGSLNGAHGLHSATLLSSGSVLLAGLPDSIGQERASPIAQSSTVALFLTPPGTDFTISPNPVVGQPVTFTDTSNPQATGWLWIFDDGTTDLRQSPTHVFTSAGTHSVALDATNGAGSQTKVKSFIVSAGSAATASRLESVAFDASNPIRQRATVTLGAQGSTWLHVRTGETQDTTLFLRFIGRDGALVTERRLVVSPGTEAVYDLAAWSPNGTFSLELVCDRSFSAWIVRSGRPGATEIRR